MSRHMILTHTAKPHDRASFSNFSFVLHFSLFFFLKFWIVIFFYNPLQSIFKCFHIQKKKTKQNKKHWNARTMLVHIFTLCVPKGSITKLSGLENKKKMKKLTLASNIVPECTWYCIQSYTWGSSVCNQINFT